MTSIDDIRTDITQRIEVAESNLAKAAAQLELCRAALDAHDRTVAAMLELGHPPAAAATVATAAPFAASVKQKSRKNRSRARRLFGAELDERREKIVAAYKRGVRPETLALRHQVSKVRILQVLREHEEKTGEKIERHWQAIARGRSAESAEDAPPMAAAER